MDILELKKLLLEMDTHTFEVLVEGVRAEKEKLETELLANNIKDIGYYIKNWEIISTNPKEGTMDVEVEFYNDVPDRPSHGGAIYTVKIR